MGAFTLPLLGREFVGASNRPSTYGARALVALVGLVLLLAVPTMDLSGPTPHPAGMQLLRFISLLINVVILLFVPVDRVARVHTERAEGTLQLVLVSGQGPLRLIGQWWLGAIGLGASLALAMAPVATLAYVFGGVSASDLIARLWSTALLTVMVAAAAVHAGCMCRSVAEGVLRTYCAMALMWIAGELAVGIGYLLSAGTLWRSPAIANAIFYGACALLAWWQLDAAVKLVRSGKAVHAHIMHRRRYAASVGLQDRWVRKRGWVSADSVPGDEPVLWRERHRRAYGSTVSDRMRLILIVTPLSLLALFHGAPWVPCIALWLTSTLILLSCIVAMPIEHVSNTLETIATTPLGMARMVDQKYRARSPFVQAAFGCLIVITLVHLLIELPGWVGTGDGSSAIRTGMLLCCALPLLRGVAWVGMYLSLASRTATSALVKAGMALMLFWLVGPLVLRAGAGSVAVLQGIAEALSPALFITDRVLDAQAAPCVSDALILCASVTLWSSVAVLIRRRCMSWQSIPALRPG